MSETNCPDCNNTIDLDDIRTIKIPDGTNTIVTCPICSAKFELQKVKIIKKVKVKVTN